MKKTFIQIGYMPNRWSKKMKQLTAAALEELLHSEIALNIMAAIEAEPDPEKKSKLKEQLPVVIFGCQLPPNGVRPTAKNGLIVPSGFCMHDWDHMTESPRQFYADHIAGREQELDIVMSFVTPRGQGLRLVTVLQPGETIAQCQHRIAALFGMEQFIDPSVKDANRLSYLPTYQYMIYIDKSGLLEREMPEVAQAMATPDAPQADPAYVIEEAEVIDDNVRTQPQPQALSIAETLSYKGLKYSTIIEALISRLATNGKVSEGERNNVLFSLVRELRHICDYNFQTLLMLVSPYFTTLPDCEVRRTIGSAIATTGRSITPVLRGVLNELINADVERADGADGLTLPRLPKLSPIEEKILSNFPKHLRHQVFLASLPIWGVYGTHVRFPYLDGRVNSLSFMVSVVGKSGSGKSYASHLYAEMTKRFSREDALERKKADEYLAICNKTADSKEKPDDPRSRVRQYGDDITTSQMLEYLDNLNGEHGIQFTEEVSRLNKAKRTIYGDNDDLYCKAFDNAIGGKESKSKQTRNIRIPIYLNTLFLGTPGAMHKFYNNPEGGLNNRIIYVFMNNVRLKKAPRYEPFNAELQAEFDAVTDKLWEAGKDGKMIELPWLEKTIQMIKNKWDREDDENPDDVWYDLGKRALVLAMRVGVLQWLLRDRPTDDKQIREIASVVKWTADAVRQGVYAFCGKEYEEINEQDNNYQQQQQQRRLSKNKKLFSILPDEFTVQDLISLRVQNGASNNVAMVLSRWVADGLVRKVGDGRYRKVPQMVA